jgi:spore germination protein KC
VKKIIFMLILVSVLLTGCWDSVETEELGVISLMGVGLSTDNNIKVVIHEEPHEKQTAGSGKPSSGSETPFYLYAETGSTIYEAVQRMSANEHHKLYFPHTRIIIVDEDLVTLKGIKPIIDFCERNPEIRLSTWILVSPRGQFDKILSTDVGINLSTGKLLEETINNYKVNPHRTINNLSDIIEMLNSSGSEFYTSGVSKAPENSDIGTIGSSLNKQKFNIKDTAVFKGEKMVGWLKAEEYRGLSWINGNVKGGIITMPFEEGVLSFRIVKTKSEVRAAIKNEKLQININIEVMSSVAEIQGDSNFMDETTVKKVREFQEGKIKKEITAAIDKARNLNSDIFGWGSYFNSKYPKFWKTIEDNWYEYYSDVEVKVNVNTIIKDIGKNYKS